MSTLASMTKVASVCYAKNELDEAEAMYRHALSGHFSAAAAAAAAPAPAAVVIERFARLGPYT